MQDFFFLPLDFQGQGTFFFPKGKLVTAAESGLFFFFFFLPLFISQFETRCRLRRGNWASGERKQYDVLKPTAAPEGGLFPKRVPRKTNPMSCV